MGVFLISSPKGITWLVFDSINTSLGSLLTLWLKGCITNFVFETDLRHHHLSSFLSSCTLHIYIYIYIYITLSHLLHHLKLLKNIDLTLISSLVTDVASILVNNTIDKVDLTLKSSLLIKLIPHFKKN